MHLSIRHREKSRLKQVVEKSDFPLSSGCTKTKSSHFMSKRLSIYTTYFDVLQEEIKPDKRWNIYFYTFISHVIVSLFIELKRITHVRNRLQFFAVILLFLRWQSAKIAIRDIYQPENPDRCFSAFLYMYIQNVSFDCLFLCISSRPSQDFLPLRGCLGQLNAQLSAPKPSHTVRREDLHDPLGVLGGKAQRLHL